MDVIPTSSSSASLLSDLASHVMGPFRSTGVATRAAGVLRHDDQPVPQDSFVRQGPPSDSPTTYSLARPSLAHPDRPRSDELNGLLGLLGSLAENRGQDGSLLLRVRQSIAFALEARSVMNFLPENSQQAFGEISLKMISELLRDARVLFKTMLEFARQARKLGLKNQPVFGNFLRVVGKLVDAVPELLDTFAPAFASAQAGGPAGLAMDFLDRIEGRQLTVGSEVSIAASFLAEVELIVDGGSVQLRMHAAASVEVSASVSVQQADPIVIDTDGSGVAINPETPFVPFDITGDGKQENVQLPGPGTALLAVDSNNNGIVDGGRELFGTQKGAGNGFEELARHDVDQDMAIDMLDPIFRRLLLFNDSNNDGYSQPDELISLMAAGISSLDLSYVDVAGRAFEENGLAQESQYTRDDGFSGGMWDVLLKYIPA
jgi:hypothetical protein